MERVSKEMAIGMKLVLDAEKCQGHGRCYALAPDLFDLDESGYAKVRGDGQITDADRELAELACGNCPEQALRLV
jgi:ferredoxin